MFKLRSYLEVVLASIFDRFWTPLEPRKLRSRADETLIFTILTFSNRGYKTSRNFERILSDFGRPKSRIIIIFLRKIEATN